MLVHCPDKYKTQRLRDDSPLALKLIPDQFGTSKINKELLTVLYADDNRLQFNEESGDVKFSCNESSILSKDLNNINLDDTNYDEDYPETIHHIRLLPGILNSKTAKSLKIVK